MDPGRIGLLKLAERRLDWLSQRQQVLAQNIANADTAGYAARDLPAFAKVMARATGQVQMTQTSARHIAPATGGAFAVRPEREASERTQDGNAVRIDDQVARVAETEMHHELATGLYRKYLGLFRIVLGRS